MSAATGPYWAGIIQDDNDISTHPAELFEGSVAQMRTFFKSRYKKQMAGYVSDIKDEDFESQPWGFAIFSLDKYRHLYIYSFERKHNTLEGGKRRRRSTRRGA
jgi:hypothetical protein